MTTYCTTYRQPNMKNFMLFLVVLSLVAISIGYGISHAVKTHGEVSYQIRACMTGDPFWHNPESGYYARYCNLEPGKVGIQILHKAADGTWQEITTFTKKIGDACKTVEQYLIDTGYVNLNWMK